MQLFSTITLADIQDGAPGPAGASSSYNLIFDKDRLLKYRTYDEQNRKYATIISPEKLTFYLVNRPEGTAEEKVDLDSYGFSISFIDFTSSIMNKDEDILTYSLLDIEDFIQGNINNFYPFLETTENLNWILDLGKIWEIQQRFQDYYATIRIPKFVYHTTNTSEGFNANLSWEDIEEGDSVFIGIYLSEPSTSSSEGELLESVLPENYDDYFWYFYGVKQSEKDPTDFLEQVITRIYQSGRLLFFSDQTFIIFDVYRINSESQEYYSLGKTLISIEWASSASLATFSLQANKIIGAIDNSKLEFSEAGLSIMNGGLKISNIINNEQKILLTFDESGDLVIQGKIYADDGIFRGSLEGVSGTFSGELQAATGTFNGGGTFSGLLSAASGSFTGDITATSGYIKKLIIGNENKSHLNLYVIENEDQEYYGGIIHEGRDEENLIFSNFSIDLDGHIFAKSISLDTGTIGKISFTDSTISSNTWSISPDVATFNNIVAQGKITTAIFEQQNIQLCGGSFIFKNGIFIEPIIITDVIINDNYTEIEYKEELFNNHLYLLTSSTTLVGNGTTRDVVFCYCEPNINIETGIGKTKISFIDPVTKGQEYNLLVDLGLIKDEIISDWLIGVNSTNAVLNKGLEPNSITLSSIDKNMQEDKISYQINPKIILGKIPSSVIGRETYGLYAESAFLTGTLTTQFKSDGNIKSAGVNTIDGATFIEGKKNLEGIVEDQSRIVFWAGADGTTSEKIQKSKFQVTENGTFYASQGIIQGGLVTDTIIHAATIYTSILSGKMDGTALIIKDADIGIDFLDENNASLMLIKKNEMSLKIPIVFNAEAQSESNIKNAILFGQKIGLADGKGKSLVINPYSLDFYDQNIEDINFINIGHGNYYFNIDENVLKLNYNHNNTERIIMRYRQDTEINVNCSLSSKNEVYLGMQENQQYTAVYKPILKNLDTKKEMIGIDLFIEEITIL